MIPTLLRISRTNLLRDRVALAMVFVLPIMFFSIFANVFGRTDMNRMSKISVAIADEDRSPQSMALVAALRADPGLNVRDSSNARTGPRAPYDRALAERLVRAGEFPVALVLPHGLGAAFPDVSGAGPPVEMLVDPSDPVAPHLIGGLLQRAAGTVFSASMGGSADNKPMQLVSTRRVDVAGDPRQRGKMISFYAAGVAVMFLLFSCSAGGGVLLDEQESGTLDRLLGTRVGMGGVLVGKWLHLTLLGVTQITVMFLWGAAVFGLDLAHHLPGFAVMTLVTASAAAAFGLVLATLCRTRQQLSGLSTILILAMSALGGSMFPRFLMSPGMQKLGLVTFNAWALDGYIKVFWREAPLLALWPQVLVLMTLAAVFLGSARLLARRWETV